MIQIQPLTLPADFFPLTDPNPVKCGNRTDLPKRQRRHTWAALGLDTRNAGEKGFKDYEIFACTECGADKKVAPKALELI